jgi:hypothetical protein
VSAPVLEGILDGGDSKHKRDWDHSNFLAKRVDGWEPVEQHDKQKIKVGHSVELLEEVFWEERQYRVLGGAHFVARKYVIRVLGGWSAIGDCVIWHHYSHFSAQVVLATAPPEEYLHMIFFTLDLANITVFEDKL